MLASSGNLFLAWETQSCDCMFCFLCQELTEQELRARSLCSEQWEVKDTDADTQQHQKRAHRSEKHIDERNWPGGQFGCLQTIHSAIIQTSCQVYRTNISKKLANCWWYLLSSGGRFLLELLLVSMWFSSPSVSCKNWNILQLAGFCRKHKFWYFRVFFFTLSEIQSDALCSLPSLKWIRWWIALG